MFLVDRLKRVCDVLPESLCRDMGADGFLLRERAAEAMACDEIFVFERSALEMGSDLRIDTPERLESICEAVFARPRRLYLEARHCDRFAALARMRGFPIVDMPAGRNDPDRVGVIVDVSSPGCARLALIWNFSTGEIGRSIERRLMKEMPRPAARAVQDMMRMGASLHTMEIDLSRLSAPPGPDEGDLSRSWFSERLMSGVGAFAELRIHAERIAKATSQKARERRIVDEAWRLFRLNRFVSMGLSASGRIAGAHRALLIGMDQGGVFDQAMMDLDGEIIYAIAMLAILEVEASDVVRSTRATPPGGATPVARKKEKESRSAGDAAALLAGAGRRPYEERLSVVSLRLSREEQALYDGRPTVSESPETGGRHATARARHVVRGHLFRARNGLIVYRRRHWRGSLSKKTVQHVL